MKYKFGLFVLLLILGNLTLAQTPETMHVREFNQKNAKKIIREYSTFISLPNHAGDYSNIMANARFLKETMQKCGIGNVQFLNALKDSVPPIVYGEVLFPGAKYNLIFYAHYDGQPANPKEWTTGLAPFSPKLLNDAITNNGQFIQLDSVSVNSDNDWRIYARSAADDKAGVFAILSAFNALKNLGLAPMCNLKFLFEGEEEIGSTHLGEVLERNQVMLQSDLLIVCDGPIHQSGNKQILFGVRGDTNMELTVYGAKRPLHSGHYGNWAPNPAMLMAKLLASMKDEDGRVTIKGFYDDVIPFSPSEKEAILKISRVDVQMKHELGIASTEMKDLNLSEAINLPSLNINGFQSGSVGAMASNQIPTSATTVIDLRLVLGNDWRKQQQKVIDHIKSQGYHVIDHDPTDEERAKYTKIIKVIALDEGYNAERTSMELPIVKEVIRAVAETTFDGNVVLQPTSGGSLPFSIFEKYLNAKAIVVPITNYDNNQHGGDENIRLGNFFDGIETMASLMLMK